MSKDAKLYRVKAKIGENFESYLYLLVDDWNRGTPFEILQGNPINDFEKFNQSLENLMNEYFGFNFFQKMDVIIPKPEKYETEDRFGNKLENTRRYEVLRKIFKRIRSIPETSEFGTVNYELTIEGEKKGLYCFPSYHDEQDSVIGISSVLKNEQGNITGYSNEPFNYEILSHQTPNASQSYGRTYFLRFKIPIIPKSAVVDGVLNITSETLPKYGFYLLTQNDPSDRWVFSVFQYPEDQTFGEFQKLNGLVLEEVGDYVDHALLSDKEKYLPYDEVLIIDSLDVEKKQAANDGVYNVILSYDSDYFELVNADPQYESDTSYPGIVRYKVDGVSNAKINIFTLFKSNEYANPGDSFEFSSIATRTTDTQLKVSPETSKVTISIATEVEQEKLKDKNNEHATTEQKGGSGSFENVNQTDYGLPNDNMSIASNNGWRKCYVSERGEQIEKIMRTISKYRRSQYDAVQNAFLPDKTQAYVAKANNIADNVTDITILPLHISDLMLSVDDERLAVGGTPIWDGVTDFEVYDKDNAGIATSKYLLNDYVIKSYTLPEIKHYYDNFLDFAPYTSATIFLPYIGEQSLPVNLIYNSNIRVEYRVHVPSGGLLVVLFINEQMIGQWQNNVGFSVKLSNSDIKSELSRLSFERGKELAGSLVNLTTSALSSFGGAVGSFSGGAIQNLKNTMMESRILDTNNHSISTSNSGGIFGWLGPQKIYITVERPIWALPKDYSKLKGYNSKQKIKLKEGKGLTKIEDVRLTFNAEKSEKEDLQRLLSAGVIL